MKNNTNTFYFAYGSNMNQDQMKFRCLNSRPLGKVSLFGYRFIVNSRGVATIIPRNYSTVRGILWSINLKHEFTLDYYEGVKKKIYFKKYCYITFFNQRVFRCFSELYARNLTNLETQNRLISSHFRPSVSSPL